MRITFVVNAKPVADGMERVLRRMDENLRDAARLGLERVATRARQTTTFKDRSGAGRRSIQAGPVSGSFLHGDLHGEVAAGMPYMTFLELGTRDHFVRPRNPRGALRWAVPGGFAFSRGHRVRGIQAKRFMADALDASFAEIVGDVQKAVELSFAQEGFV